MCLSARTAHRRGKGSTCSKPIVWFVFHNHFLIVKIAIGQNELSVNQVVDQFFQLVRINLMSFKFLIDYSPDVLMLCCLSFFYSKMPITQR